MLRGPGGEAGEGRQRFGHPERLTAWRIQNDYRRLLHGRVKPGVL